MIIVFSIAGFIILLFVIGRIRLAVQFNMQVKGLFAQSKSISYQTLLKTQLGNLPEPVQRYFNYNLKDGQHYVSYARIKHKGDFTYAKFKIT